MNKTFLYVINPISYYFCINKHYFFFLIIIIIRKALSASYWWNSHLQHEKNITDKCIKSTNICTTRWKCYECRTVITLPPVSFSLVSLLYMCGWLASHLITMWEVSKFKVGLASLFSFCRFFLLKLSFSHFLFFFFPETKHSVFLFRANLFISNSAVYFPPRGLENDWNNLKTKPNIKLNFYCWFLNWIFKETYKSIVHSVLLERSLPFKCRDTYD